MAAVIGTKIGKRLIEALGLPKHTRWVEFRIAHNEIVSVRCGYYPDLSDPTELVEALAEFELHEKTPNVELSGGASQPSAPTQGSASDLRRTE